MVLPDPSNGPCLFLDGCRVVVSGVADMIPRQDVEQMLISFGAAVQKSGVNGESPKPKALNPA